jgi:hypothetical protein
VTLAIGGWFKQGIDALRGGCGGIVDPLEDNDAEMLISLNRRDPKVFDVYRRMEGFLTRHLGSRAEGPPPA